MTTFSDDLLSRHDVAWQAATRHRFVRELADDALPDEVYARYLVLDYAFIEQLVSLVGHTVAVAPTWPPRSGSRAFSAY